MFEMHEVQPSALTIEGLDRGDDASAVANRREHPDSRNLSGVGWASSCQTCRVRQHGPHVTARPRPEHPAH